MSHLRHLSGRPVVVVDPHSHAVGEAGATSRVGTQGPLGRERVLYALPIGGTGPVRLVAPIVLRDQDSAMIADAAAAVIGKDGVLVSRFLSAGRVEDTRRL